MDDFLQVVCYDGSHPPETSYNNVNSLIGREKIDKFGRRKAGHDKGTEFRNSKLDYDTRMSEYKDKQGYECREGKKNDNYNYRYGREDYEKLIEYREFRFDYDKRTDSDGCPSFEKREYFMNKPVDYVLPDKQHLNRFVLKHQTRLSELERKDLCDERQSQLFQSKKDTFYKDKSINVNQNFSLMVNHEVKSNEIDKQKYSDNGKHSGNGINSNSKSDSNNEVNLNNDKNLTKAIHSNNERCSLQFPSKKDDCRKDKNVNNNRNYSRTLDHQLRLNQIENCSGNKSTNCKSSDDEQGGNLRRSDDEMEIDDTVNEESESGIKDDAGCKDEDKSVKSDDSCDDTEDEDPIIKKNRLDHSNYVKGKKRGPKLKKMPEKTFPCQLCTYSSTRKHDLKRHFKRVHHNNPNHVPSLSEMDKKRKNRAIISDKDMTEDGKIKHSVIVRGQKRGPKMKHVYDKTYPCMLCTYAATRPFDLKRHVSTVHRKEKPFSCEYCSFSAGLAETLKQHILKMHNETKYKCDSCDFTSAKKLEYMKHLKDDHNYMPYSCESCNFSCIWNIELVQHRVKIHGK